MLEVSTEVESMLEAIISVAVPRDWKQELVLKYGASIEVIECLGVGERGCRNFIEVRVPKDNVDDAVRDVMCHPTVVETDLDHVGDGVMKGTVTTKRCIACRETLGGRAFIVGASIDADGMLVQHLLVEDHAAVREVIAKLEARGHRTELLRLRALDTNRLLTSRQEDLLSVAYSLGYYDDPKGVELRDLARRFGVSISTISEGLRNGQRKLMENYFGA